MVWDPTHPAEDSAVVSSPLRDNFAVLDTALVAPLTALANNQVLIKAAGPVLAGVTPGTNGWVLTLVGGVPTWVVLPVDPGFANPLTTLGDLIVAAGGGAPGRLGIGANGTVLKVTSGAVGWAQLVTALGDLIVGNASGQPSVLSVGTAGYVLTMVSGTPTWAAVPVDPGFANPMTTVGDLIVGGGSGTPTRLAASTTGHVLTLAAGTPTWAAPTGGGGGGTATVPLPLEQATLPDGTGTINNPPELIRHLTATGQTSNAPKPTSTAAKFDATTDEHLMWSFMLPTNYGSGGTIRLKWMSLTATTGTCVWKAGAALHSDGVNGVGFTPFNAADVVSSVVPTGLSTPREATITLTMTGAGPNRWGTVFIGRDADNAADTLVGDAVLVGAQFEYTPA